VNWGAYELGIPLAMAEDLRANPHPFGQIPCLVDEEDGGNDGTKGNAMVVVFESGAILNYLLSKAEEMPDKNMGQCKRGSSGTMLAGEIGSWIAWANASLDPICFLETPDGKVYDTGLRKPNRRIDTLDSILSKRDYLLESNAFSLADVAVASYLLYVPQFFRDIDLRRWPNVVRYMKRCASRKCYGMAFGPAVQQFLITVLEQMEEKDEDGFGDNDGGGGTTKKKLFGMF